MRVGAALLVALAGGAAGADTSAPGWQLAQLPRVPPPGPTIPTRPLGVAVIPEGQQVEVHVGRPQRFQAETVGSDLRFAWTLDGEPQGSESQWTFTPALAQIGARRVEVMVTGAGTRFRRAWTVTVFPPQAPRITQASPRGDDVKLEVERTVSLRFGAEPVGPGDKIAVAWTVDGAPAGDGTTLRLRGAHVGTMEARAVATSSFGSSVERTWRITVTATTTTLPLQMAVPLTTLAPPPPPPPQVASLGPPPTLPAAPPSTLPPPSAAGGEREVRALLDRYVAAWRSRDVGELQRIGQVTNASQADAMREYFAKIEDLEDRKSVV